MGFALIIASERNMPLLMINNVKLKIEKALQRTNCLFYPKQWFKIILLVFNYYHCHNNPRGFLKHVQGFSQVLLKFVLGAT